MFRLPQRAYVLRRHFHTHSLTYISSLIDQLLSSRSQNISYSLNSTYAQLIKFGFSSTTYLCNCCVDLFLKSGVPGDAVKAFHEMPNKDIVSWNLYLKVFVKWFDVGMARQVLDEMPERDVVSYNSMISGYISSGFRQDALAMFFQMQNAGVRPSGYTFSLLISCVKSADHGKQMHGIMLRNGVEYRSLVVGNSLIDMYGKLGLMDYAIAVFLTMMRVDVISWNSLISGCCKSGYEGLAFAQFCSMRTTEYKPDEYTISSVLTACSSLRNLEKGKQILCLCIKMGFLWNTIVSSAAIDLFSKCNRMEEAIRLFDESNMFDSALCNSMIASYAKHGLEENAVELFVLALKKNIRPTEFMLSCILSFAAVFLPVELGNQVHSLVIKCGFESDVIVSSSLVEMYSKFGLADSAFNIFSAMGIRDLIAWNTMIMGLTYNGKVAESLNLFGELRKSGLCPDHITFSSVLLACTYGGFLEEGIRIFSLMEKDYGLTPRIEHYGYLVDMMCRAGKIEEAMAILEMIPHEPNALMFEYILRACGECRNLKLIERAAERMMELEPRSSLPYLVLAHVYARMGLWERIVRVKRGMRRIITKELVSCSWMGIKGHIFTFEANQMVYHGLQDVYLTLESLMQNMQDENDNYTQLNAMDIDGE